MPHHGGISPSAELSALCLVALEEHCYNLLSPFLSFLWKHPRLCLWVWVCVGTDDGAQEVVKHILEDVVTSAVKGKKNQGTLTHLP